MGDQTAAGRRNRKAWRTAVIGTTLLVAVSVVLGLLVFDKVRDASDRST